MTFISIDGGVVVTEVSWRAEHAPHGDPTEARTGTDDEWMRGLRCPCGVVLVLEIASGLHPRAAAAEGAPE